MHPVRPLATVLVVLAATQAAGAAAQVDSTPPRTSPAGAYSAPQALRGQSVYAAECGRCHSTTEHSGPDFRQSWNGVTVMKLFDYVRSTMPDDGPGELTEQQYLDVTAYILKLNGMPAGDSALTADTTVLKKLLIDIKAKATSRREGGRPAGATLLAITAALAMLGAGSTSLNRGA